MAIPRAGEAQEVGSGGGGSTTAHAIDGSLHTGTLADAQVPAGIMRDAEHASDAHAQGLTGPVTRLRNGTDASKPASGNTEGDVWWATDTDKLYVWDGAAWKELGLVAHASSHQVGGSDVVAAGRVRTGTDAAKPGTGNTEGDVWWATDTDVLSIWNGAAWSQVWPPLDANLPAGLMRDSEHAADAHGQNLTGPVTRVRNGLDASKPGAGNTEGDVWWATDTDKLYVWTGTAWKEVGAPPTAKRTLTLVLGRTGVSNLYTDSQLLHDAYSGLNQCSFVIPFAAHLTAVSCRRELALTAGTGTFQIFKNGVDAGVTYDLVLNTGTPQQAYATFSPGLALAAGDRIDCRITTDASWAPDSDVIHIMVVVED